MLRYELTDERWGPPTAEPDDHALGRRLWPDFASPFNCHNAPDFARPARSSSTAALTVALAGTPNSGKSTLFNALTGLRQKVANCRVSVAGFDRVMYSYFCTGQFYSPILTLASRI
jgi:hypothetical protein